jgi:glutathione reductase (NADPH)
VLQDEDTGRIVGAHLLGPHAAEVINLFALAIRLDIPAAELKKVLYAYPTSASDIPFMV